LVLIDNDSDNNNGRRLGWADVTNTGVAGVNVGAGGHSPLLYEYFVTVLLAIKLINP